MLTWLTDRGYTFQEHYWFTGIYNTSLINLNGRLYDPLVGRMLSPDPYVPDATNSQDYNKYTYARNNPLRYSDPNGEWVHIAVGAFIGGVVNLTFQAINGNVNSVGDGLKYFGVGAVSGALTAAVGPAAAGAIGIGGIAGGAISGAITGFVGGFANEFGNSLVKGNNLQVAFNDGMTGGKWGAAFGGVIGGAVGGYQAYRNGANIWNGKMPKVSEGMYYDEFKNNARNSIDEAAGDSKGGFPGAKIVDDGILTDEEYLVKTARQAEDEIGGVGRFAGTAKHQYAFNMIRTNRLSLEVNKYFVRGPKGQQVRGYLDVYNPESQRIFDFKFGNAKMSFDQMMKYFKAFPNSKEIVIIRPTGYDILTRP